MTESARPTKEQELESIFNEAADMAVANLTAYKENAEFDANSKRGKLVVAALNFWNERDTLLELVISASNDPVKNSMTTSILSSFRELAKEDGLRMKTSGSLAYTAVYARNLAGISQGSKYQETLTALLDQFTTPK